MLGPPGGFQFAEAVPAAGENGEPAARRVLDVLSRIDLVRTSERVLADAGRLLPPELRSLAAIHLATARLFGRSLARVINYGDRLTAAAKALGLAAAVPS